MATWRLDPEVKPASVGVDEAVLERMVAGFRDGVESGALCRGAQMAMYRGIRAPIRWGTGFHLGGFGEGGSGRTFGHGGAGGQIGFADRSHRLAFAFVSNGERSGKYLPWRVGLQSQAFAACKD